MALLAAIVRWSLHNRPIVIVLTLVFCVLGVRAAIALPIDAVPDLTNVQVQIITAAPALSPVEVEQYVSTPVERAMAGIPNTTEIRSLSKYGLSVVTVVFKDDTSIYFARQLVTEHMRDAQEAVPAQYGKPEMGPISTGLGEILQFTVENDSLTLMQLEDVLEWQIAPQVRMVPGIVEVNSLGGEVRQYQVVLDPNRLQAADVSVLQVTNALEKANANAGGGYLEYNQEHVVIGTNGQVKSLEDLRHVVIGATPQGVPITINTVGDVRFGARMRRGAATKDGKGEVCVGVALMLMGESSRVVTAAVKKKLSELEPSLPKGTHVNVFYDRSVLVDRTTHTVFKNLVEGALLVVAVLFLVLGDLRGGLVVSLVIPLALIAAVFAMNTLGLSGNLMSLGAIDFGLLVDGAVIIVENTVRRMSERRAELGRPLTSGERRDLVEAATLEVRSASVFGEAIIAIVYLPILTLSGIEGKLFRPMATTVLLALAGAFVFSLTVVPVLASALVRERATETETWIVRLAHRFYVPALARALRHRWLTVGVAVALLAASVVVLGRIGAEFVPTLDEGDLLIEARRLPGIALTESNVTATRLERALLQIPEVLHVVSKTGAPAIATDPMGVEQSDVYVNLRPRAEWRKGLQRDALIAEIKSKMELVPEIGGGVSQPIEQRENELVAGVRSDVAAILYGPDLEELAKTAAEMANALSKVKGVADIKTEQVAGLHYLRVVPDRYKLARYGLTIDDINEVTETLAVGHKVGDILEGDRRFAMVVKVDHGYEGDLDVLTSLPLRSVSGEVVPLGDVATIELGTGPAEINRESQSRRITVEFNVRQRDMMTVVQEAQRAMANVTLPAGYRVVWAGQFEHYTEARQRLEVVVPLSLVLIAFLLWLAFRSLRDAALIFLNVPFAIVGGVFALAIRRIPFSISAGVGFIALFGVAVLNGLVLVSFARTLEERGATHGDAIKRAAEMRLRPVLMTALVASLGFLPMALSTAPGSEVQRPLATVVIGGLVTATVLTLLVLPIAYAYFGRGAPREAAPEAVKGASPDGA